MAATSRTNPWSEEATDLVRALSGGLLFGIPLLYTMEVWWVGTETEASRVFGVLLLTFLPVWFLNRTSGFRQGKDVKLVDAFMDSIETVALGLLASAAFLALLKEVTLDTPMNEAIGKIVFEATPFGIGIALAHHFLRRGRVDDDDDGSESKAKTPLQATIADIGATLIGAIFIAFNIAPTVEVPMIASALGPYSLVVVMVVSLVVSFCIVFVAGFSDQESRQSQEGLFQRPITETVACSFLALLASGVMTWYFQRLDAGAPWQETLSHIVVLGLPASVGGAAGRLAT